jgi:hypothetical protein
MHFCRCLISDDAIAREPSALDHAAWPWAPFAPRFECPLRTLGMLEIPMSQKGYKERSQSRRSLVLLPAWNRLDWRRVIDSLKGIPFHLQIRPRVNLGCFDIYMAEEVADHVKRDSALQQVHSLCVSERVRTHYPVQAGVLVSCFDEILLKDVTDSRARQSLIARVLEKRFIELFGAIEMMFTYVIA